MSSKNIGKWLIGIGAAVAFIARQKLSFLVQGVYLNGIITQQLIPIRVAVSLINQTIGSLLVRSISGSLICNGMVVATINQVVNKRIPSRTTVNQNIYIDIHSQEALQALNANIQSGDISNLAFELIGEVVVGEQFPVGIKFNKVFTWQDIQQMI